MRIRGCGALLSLMVSAACNGLCICTIPHAAVSLVAAVEFTVTLC